MINDATFRMFFSWYVGLFIVNLFNILNLIYHYFMKDLQGPRGLKGEIGERVFPDRMISVDVRFGVLLQLTLPEVMVYIDDADKIESKTKSVGTSDAGTDFKINTTDLTYAGRTGSIMIHGDKDDTDDLEVFKILESIFATKTIPPTLSVGTTLSNFSGLSPTEKIGLFDDYKSVINLLTNNNYIVLVQLPYKAIHDFLINAKSITNFETEYTNLQPETTQSAPGMEILILLYKIN